MRDDRHVGRLAPALEVARREMLENVSTWKTPLALGLVTILLVAGVLSLAGAYASSVGAYELVQDEFASNGRESSAQAIAHRVLAQPNVLALLVGGPGESVRASFAAPAEVTNETAAVRVDPLRLRFPPTDLGTVGVGVLTLLAVLFSYDAVAGEKERGTLKVLLVNPLTRRDVLVGKYLGAMGSLVLPLAAALVVAVVLLAFAGVRFGPGDFARLGIVLALLVLLLSAFVLAGLAVSALTHRTPVAILALTFLWLVLVTGAGGVAAYAASVDSDARALDDVLVELAAIDRHYDELDRELAADIAALEARRDASNGTLPPEEASRLDALKRERESLPRLSAEDASALLGAYFRSGEIDLRRAERLAALSPAESFRSVAQTLARTDYASTRQDLDEFSAYLREVEVARRAHDESGRPADDFLPPAYRNAPTETGADLARGAYFAVALLVQNAVALAAAVLAVERYDVR